MNWVPRQVWVAEDIDGVPSRSAVDLKRLNGEPRVRRYVPQAEVELVYRRLCDGDAAGALELLKRLAGIQNPTAPKA